MNPLVVYIVLAANLIAFLQMGIDKRLAIKQKQRISEAQLIAPTLFGGIIGVVLGMLAFRHKTAKRSFQLKLAVAFASFLAVIYFYLKR
jgi:uncharacterized membrane protein YsdA (DUF1294 family)